MRTFKVFSLPPPPKLCLGDWTHCRASVTGGLADRGDEQGHLVLEGLALSNDRNTSGYTNAYSLCPDPTADGTADNEFTVPGVRKKWSVVTRHNVCGGADCSPPQTEACSVQCQMDCQHTDWADSTCTAAVTCDASSIERAGVGERQLLFLRSRFHSAKD